jgi:two-component system, chemotaxis family, chemotaxis protein CheY
MQRRVLIVDDSTVMRRVIRDSLESDGWEVVGEAANGSEAVVCYQRVWPDAVTLDMTMPENDGLQVVDMIFEIDPKAKIVVVSALNQTRLTAKAIQAGVQDFVVKPFLPEQLQTALRATLDEPATV